MAFGFTCTYCGKSMEQENVLFQMDYLLDRRSWSENEAEVKTGVKPLKVLKLYVSEAELWEIYRRGMPCRTEPGMRLCSVTFGEVMSLLFNQNNYNIKNAELTYEQLCMFLDGRDSGWSEEVDAAEYERVQNLMWKLANGGTRDSVTYSKPLEDRLSLLKADLRRVRKMYGKDNNADWKRASGEDENQKQYISAWDEMKFVFRLGMETDEDTNGTQVLLGYYVQPADESDTKLGNTIPYKDSRVCPQCRGKLFRGAGTAKHRTAMFIGSTGTGKTSTILALSHLVHYQNEDPIWSGKELDMVDKIKLCTPDGKLWNDMRKYGDGIAPAKTLSEMLTSNEDPEEKQDKALAYSSTVEVFDKNGEKNYLSFMDAPGEVCDEKTGRVRDDLIRDEFNAIVTCDAYVLCFEDSVARDEREQGVAKDKTSYVGKHKDMVLGWVREIQKIRAEYRKNIEMPGDYAPVMVLFTKSREIEASNYQEQTARKENRAQYYLFPEEEAAIRTNTEWKEVLDSIGNDPQLKNAYCAQLRCSPYGYASPKVVDQENIQRPNPKNVDKLLRWLLYATGLVSMDLTKYGLGEDNYVIPPENRLLLPDAKLVRDNPKMVIPYSGTLLERIRWYNEKPYMPAVAVAMLRRKLFTNAQPADRDYVRFMDDGAQMHKIWRQYHPKK